MASVRAELASFRAAVDAAVDSLLPRADDMTESQAYLAVAAHVRKATGKDAPFHRGCRLGHSRRAGLVRKGLLQRHYPELLREALRLISELKNCAGVHSEKERVCGKLFCKDDARELSTEVAHRRMLLQTVPSVFSDVFNEAAKDGRDGVVELHGGKESSWWTGSRGSGLAFSRGGKKRTRAAANALMKKLEAEQPAPAAVTHQSDPTNPESATV